MPTEHPYLLVPVQLHTPPPGYPDSWLAIALSDAGGMHGADMMAVVGGTTGTTAAGGTAAAATDGGAKWRALDLHSLDFVRPQMDDQQVRGRVGHGPMGGRHQSAWRVL